METTTPTNARKNLYELLRRVSEESIPIEITSKKNGESAILISKKDWNAIQETLYLQNTGVISRIKDFEEEETEELGEIDWDTL